MLVALNLILSRQDPRQREKIDLNGYFHTSLWCIKRFYEGLKGLKVFILIQISEMHGTGGVNPLLPDIH